MNEAIIEAFRKLRLEYDQLSPGDRAVLRRCRDGDAVQLEGVFWRIFDNSGLRDAKVHPETAANVVSAFPGASHENRRAFDLGAFLFQLLKPDGDPKKKAEVPASQSMPFRQLVRSMDREQLCAKLRKLLKRSEKPVDWGVLGSDILYFGPHVQRRWIQSFYSSIPQETTRV